jgi:hypothetical protein
VVFVGVEFLGGLGVLLLLVVSRLDGLSGLFGL